MAPIVVGLLLTSAGVGVHLEEVADLPLNDAAEVADSLARAIELRSGLPARVDDPLAPRCPREGRCLGDVVARTGATRLVFLRLIGGITKIRVVAARLDKALVVAEAVATLSRDGSEAVEALDRLAGSLFPDRLAAATDDARLIAMPVVSPKSSGFARAAPWVLLSVSAATAVAGAVLGRSASSARDRIETGTLAGDDYTAALDQMRDHGAASNVLLGVAVGTAATAIAWLLLR